MHKAILVNPTAKTVTLVEIPKKNSLRTMQELVGGRIEGIGYMQPDGKVGDFKDDFLYCDEEGLFDEETDFNYVKGYGQEIYRGNILITGSDGEGGTANVKMTVEQAQTYFIPVSKHNIGALVG